jgi:hypothetical protein
MRLLICFLLFATSLFSLQLKDPETGRLKESARELLALFEVPEELTDEEILPYLQAHWYQAGKERWEMKLSHEKKKGEAFPILLRLKCIRSIYPKKPHYDYALVLGAPGKTMERRLDYLFSQWLNGVTFDQIVLLTGQRDLNPTLESFPEGLTSETELFVHLMENHPLKWVAPYTVVDSPKSLQEDGSLRRPTTESTVCDWLLTKPRAGLCLAISSQPFVGYQEAVVRCFLPDGFEVEAIGPGTPTWPKVALDIPNQNIPLPISIYLDNFAKWLYYEEEYEKRASKSLSDQTR